jgi:membrane-bound ClpP family serine protease
MTAIVLLFVCGALLLTAEVFLPGAIAGILGGCALLGGAILSFFEYGPTGGFTASVAAVVLVGVMLYVELVWLPKTRFGRDLVVQSTVAGVSQPAVAEREVIGQEAVALTTLSPSGMVEIAGKRYEAYCRSGQAARGSRLAVVGVETFRVIVSDPKSS